MLDSLRQIPWSDVANGVVEVVILLSGVALFRAVCRSPTRIAALGGFVIAWVFAAALGDPVWRGCAIFAGVGWVGAFVMAWYGRHAAETGLAPDILDVSGEWPRWLLVGPLGAILACFLLIGLDDLLGTHGLFGIALWQDPGFTMDDLQDPTYPKLVHLFVFRVLLAMAFDFAIVAALLAAVLLPVLGATALVRRVRTGGWT